MAAAVACGAVGVWSPCGFSMIETIGASGRGRATKIASAATFGVGAFVGGVATFGALAAGGALLAPAWEHGAAVAAAVAIAAAVAEVRGVRVVPQIRRQVPELWRRVLPLPLATFLYGVLLGLGFTTFVLTLGFWALAAITFALGDLALGAAVGTAFGVGRALPVVALAPLAERGAGERVASLLGERPALLRGFRVATAAALAACALALAATSAVAATLAVGARDPSASGGFVAWQGARSGVLLREPAGRDAAAHHLALRTPLGGTNPVVGGSLLAWRVGDTVQIVRAVDLAPVAEVALPHADALAISDRWLVYRQRGLDGTDRIVARRLVALETEVAVAAVRAPAQLGRPSLDGDVAVFHVARRRSSAIVEVDLQTRARRVLRRSSVDQLANPSVRGGSLLYVRQSGVSQQLLLGPRRPGAGGRVLRRAPPVGRRDAGFQIGYSRWTLTPRPGRATSLFWTTALSPTHAYLTLLPLDGRRGRATVVRIPR